MMAFMSKVFPFVPGAAWVDEDATEFVSLQVDAVQTAERANFVECLGELFGREAHQRDVIHCVFIEVA